MPSLVRLSVKPRRIFYVCILSSLRRRSFVALGFKHWRQIAFVFLTRIPHRDIAANITNWQSKTPMASDKFVLGSEYLSRKVITFLEFSKTGASSEKRFNPA